ncbi:potassium-transporting ATPase subunit KdpC [Duganella sp. FT92W]|uniref:Potassium-transporting ATPase KdpC subunit n=1 Tax=Pseudoduganella rivuli TaxID=2666085 RepID=A0A7X2LUM8_9BURK|nr:potassium-transporting ATPase subunit KdpC [Pseudoduganella rivuli]MRV74596.1 potassium-transporting ATPase subunit KdpC [Pseudoduganella rivuli]
MMSQLRPALAVFGALTLVCGVLYPIAVTGIAGAAFPAQAAGSIIEADGKPAGSELIGQPFTSPTYFWGRPSATGPMPANAAGSSGSNLGPLNPALADNVKSRIDALRAADPDNKAPIPVDLVTASGSGLDPDISVAAALYQARRVAAARGMPEQQVRALIERESRQRQAGFFGEPRVNVLRLNLALDGKTLHTR